MGNQNPAQLMLRAGRNQMNQIVTVHDGGRVVPSAHVLGEWGDRAPLAVTEALGLPWPQKTGSIITGRAEVICIRERRYGISFPYRLIEMVGRKNRLLI